MQQTRPTRMENPFRPDEKFIFRLRMHIFSLRMCIFRLEMYILRLKIKNPSAKTGLPAPVDRSSCPAILLFLAARTRQTPAAWLERQA